MDFVVIQVIVVVVYILFLATITYHLLNFLGIRSSKKNFVKIYNNYFKDLDEKKYLSLDVDLQIDLYLFGMSTLDLVNINDYKSDDEFIKKYNHLKKIVVYCEKYIETNKL